MKTNIADRPLTLAAHFRTVATLLRSNVVEYDWYGPHSCNCGLVAQSVLGVSSDTLDKRINALAKKHKLSDHHWGNLAKHACPITGIPAAGIFSGLKGAGIEFIDFSQLEALSNLDVLARISADKTHVDTKVKRRFFRADVVETIQKEIEPDERPSLIVYLEAWAAMIEEFHAKNTPTDAALEALESRPLVTHKSGQ